MLAFLVGFNTTTAWAQNQQIITPDPTTQTASPNAAVSINVNYSTNPANLLSTGIGLRIHFNSAQLAFVNLSNVLSTSLIATGTPQADTSDFDQDANTDTFVLVSWADINGQWPPGTFPVTLYMANFTTAAGFTGTTVNFSASSTAAGFTLNATSAMINRAVNNPPIANAQSVSTIRNQAVNSTLTGSDPEGASLTFSIQTQPANGTLSGTPPNVTYTPNTDFVGEDSFTFTVNDGTNTSQPATVTITVSEIPPSANAPVANADTAETPSGVLVTIDVLANDTDADGNTLSISGVTQGANGTVTANGMVTYTPNADFLGTDTFTYTVSDGTGNTAEGTVTVTVRPVVIGTSPVSPPADTPITVTTTDGETTVLAVSVTTGAEGVGLTTVTVNILQSTGDPTVADMIVVSIVNDANNNGVADDGEDVLASAPLSDAVDDVLTLTVTAAGDLPAGTTTNLLVTVEVDTTTTASLVGPGLSKTMTRMGWLAVLPAVVGMLLFPRLRRRYPRLYLGVVLLMLVGSLVLASCNDDGGQTLTFTPSVPANGIAGTGATTATAFTAPATAITGPAITVSP
jgi:hypothetical protein